MSSLDVLDDFREDQIELDSGLINPVYRFDQHFISNDSYRIDYVFVGFDGLTRQITISTNTRDLLLQGIEIVENSYSFKCDPSSVVTISINSLEKQIIVDQEGVVITILGFYVDGIYGPKITFQIENNSKEAVAVRLIDLSVNGVKVSELSSFEQVSSGTSRIYPEYLDITLLDTVTADTDTIMSIDFKLVASSIVDHAVGPQLFVTDVIHLAPVVSH